MTARLWVRTFPRIDDPAEMTTILLFSLRGLWGDLEPYSSAVVVKKAPDHHGLSLGKNTGLLIVECPLTQVQAVRAALTLVTPPPYLAETIFQFDVVDVQENARRLKENVAEVPS